MVIGIDASRAFLKRRTGIEEYSYQVIKHLRDVISVDTEVILYVRKEMGSDDVVIDFGLPENWRVKTVQAPRFCTQIRMGWELLRDNASVLFVPLHTLLVLHPVYTILRFLLGKKKLRTVVVVHGLEYEFYGGVFFWQRIYMRAAIRFSSRVASRVITVSENTKKDLVAMYGIEKEKVSVIYEGYERNRIDNHESRIMDQIQKPFLLFIGRLEERKSVVRIIEAFEILKEKYKILHELVLVGKPGFGYERIQAKIQDSRFKIHIRELGYVTEAEKWELLQNAEVFLFPTLYEGFGIPVLEAQSVGVPVVTSNISSLPEVAGDGAIFVDPFSTESIAQGIYQVLSDQGVRSGM